MKSSMRVEGARVVAAMTPPVSKAPFNRGCLVLKSSDGSIFWTANYTGEELDEVNVISWLHHQPPAWHRFMHDFNTLYARGKGQV